MGSAVPESPSGTHSVKSRSVLRQRGQRGQRVSLNLCLPPFQSPLLHLKVGDDYLEYLSELDKKLKFVREDKIAMVGLGDEVSWRNNK